MLHINCSEKSINLRLFSKYLVEPLLRPSRSKDVLGLILGPIAEQGFVQAWTIGAAVNNLPGMFFGRPLSQAIIAFTLISLILPWYLNRKNQTKVGTENA